MGGVHMQGVDAPEEWSSYIVAEDPRYPTAVVQGPKRFGIRFNPDTMEIDQRPVCLCHAYEPGECACDAPWEECCEP